MTTRNPFDPNGILASSTPSTALSYEVFEGTPTGTALATLLADTDPSLLTPDAQLAFIAASERLLAWVQSRQNAGLVAFAGTAPRDQIVHVDGRTVVIADPRRSEIALECLWSEQMAHNRLAVARTLATDLPATADALSKGRISALRASTLCEAASALTRRIDDLLGEPNTADQRQHLLSMRSGMLADLERRSVEYACAHDCSRTRQQVRRSIAAIDPAGAVSRAAAARRQQTDVTISHLHDGISMLVAVMPTEHALACLQAVDDLVNAGAHTDGVSPVGMRRADALHRLVTGSPAGATVATAPARVRLNVTIDHATLLGLRDDAAVIEGAGPIPGSIVRELLGDSDAAIRWLVTDESGVVTGVSDRYRIGGRLRALITARDGTCRVNNCSRAARRCQIDHVVPFDEGGRSAPENLIALCARHHRLKTHAGYDVRVCNDGSVMITPPHGSPRVAEPYAF